MPLISALHYQLILIMFHESKNNLSVCTCTLLLHRNPKVHLSYEVTPSHPQKNLRVNKQQENLQCTVNLNVYVNLNA